MVDCDSVFFLELSNKILDKGCYLRFRVKGESMRPSLRDDDIIRIKQKNTSKLGPGDLILYRNSASKLVAHRVSKIMFKDNKLIFITKGDFNLCFDDYVYPENILGRIFAIERDKQIIFLDTGINKLKSVFYIKYGYFKRWIYLFFKGIKCLLRHRLLGSVLRKIQNPLIYSRLAKKFLGKNITYQAETPDDVSSLAQLYSIYYWPSKPDDHIELYNRPFESTSGCRCCFIAKKTNRIIGSCMIENSSAPEKFPSGWRINYLFINWRYRRIGVAENLVKLCIEKATEEGACSVNKQVFGNNIPMINLCYKLGFYREPAHNLNMQTENKINERTPKLILFTKKLKTHI